MGQQRQRQTGSKAQADPDGHYDAAHPPPHTRVVVMADIRFEIPKGTRTKKPRPKYRAVRIKSGCGRIDEHILIVEKVIGRKLRNQEEVHHVDGNGTNNAHTNLVACSNKAYHRLLHVRTEALIESGNANFRKCRWCHKWDATENMQNMEKKNPNGSYQHRECANAAWRAWYNGKKINRCGEGTAA